MVKDPWCAPEPYDVFNNHGSNTSYDAVASKLSHRNCMAYEDPYTVLGVHKGASKQDVQKAYRELALKHHPDKDLSLEAAQRFQRISRAATLILKEV